MALFLLFSYVLLRQTGTLQWRQTKAFWDRFYRIYSSFCAAILLILTLFYFYLNQFLYKPEGLLEGYTLLHLLSHYYLFSLTLRCVNIMAVKKLRIANKLWVRIISLAIDAILSIADTTLMILASFYIRIDLLHTNILERSNADQHFVFYDLFVNPIFRQELFANYIAGFTFVILLIMAANFVIILKKN